MNKEIKRDMSIKLKPRVAVLLAAFNGIHYLEEQLNSILSQEGVAVEVFISVDVSTDGSESWIDQAALLDFRIHVLPHGKRFGGAAPNFFRLLREVDFDAFDYVSLADQDDIWLPTKLVQAHHLLMEQLAVAYSSNAIAFWPNEKTRFIDKAQPQTKWDYLFEAAGPGCTYVLRASLAIEIQLLIKTKADLMKLVGLHDWFIYAFARSQGYRWVIDKKALIYYRQHSQNQVGVNSGFRAFFRRAQKVSSGWALNQSVLIAKIIGMDANPFVRIWSSGRSSGILRLGLSFWECRRSIPDKFLFLLSCLYLAILGKKSGE